MAKFDYFNQFVNNGVPFMEGREKADLETIRDDDNFYHIEEFAFIRDENGKEFPVFIVAEDKSHFYFGGLALSDMLTKVKDDGQEAILARQGIKFVTKTNKKGNRTYTALVFE